MMGEVLPQSTNSLPSEDGKTASAESAPQKPDDAQAQAKEQPKEQANKEQHTTSDQDAGNKAKAHDDDVWITSGFQVISASYSSARQSVSVRCVNRCSTQATFEGCIVSRQHENRGNTWVSRPAVVDAGREVVFTFNSSPGFRDRAKHYDFGWRRVDVANQHVSRTPMLALLPEDQAPLCMAWTCCIVLALMFVVAVVYQEASSAFKEPPHIVSARGRAYQVYTNQDSVGNDIELRSDLARNVTALMAHCDGTRSCIAFNNLGWFKHSVKPMSEWSPINAKAYAHTFYWALAENHAKVCVAPERVSGLGVVVPLCRPSNGTCWSNLRLAVLNTVEYGRFHDLVRAHTGLTLLDGEAGHQALTSRMIYMATAVAVSEMATQWHPENGFANTYLTVTPTATSWWSRHVSGNGGFYADRCRILVQPDTNTTHMEMPSKAEVAPLFRAAMLAHRVKTHLGLHMVLVDDAVVSEAAQALTQLLDMRFSSPFLHETRCLPQGLSLVLIPPTFWKCDYWLDNQVLRIKTNFEPAVLLTRLREKRLCLPVMQ